MRALIDQPTTRRLPRSRMQARYSRPSSVANVREVGHPRAIDLPSSETAIQNVGCNRLRMRRICRHPIRAFSRRDAKFVVADSYVPLSWPTRNAACVRAPHDARPTVAALWSPRESLRLAHPAPHWRSSARSAHAPATDKIPCAKRPKTRHIRLTQKRSLCISIQAYLTATPSRNTPPPFLRFQDPSFALASSRRNRRILGLELAHRAFRGILLAPLSALSLPARFSRTQLCRLDSGIPNRLAAWLPPIDSANRTASTLNSSE